MNIQRHSQLLLIAIIVQASVAFGVDTSEVSFGNGATYDDVVRISRTAGGEMLFADAVTTPITLLELAQPASDHGALTGLDGDDHAQYLTEGRHAVEHDTTFNAALVVPADVAGNATLGAHLVDSRIHVRRDAPEQISSAWQFLARPELYAGARLSAAGVAGDAALEFLATSGMATIGWDDSLDRFTLDRGRTATYNSTAMADGFAMNRDTFTLEPTSGVLDAGDMRAATTQFDFTLEGASEFEAPAFVVAAYRAVRLESNSSGEATGRAVGLVGTADSFLSDATLIGVVATLPEDAPTTGAVGLLAGIEASAIGSYAIPAGAWAGVFEGNTLTTGEARADVFALGGGSDAQVVWRRGTGSPEGVVAAPVGSLYSRMDGGAGSTLYVKESGGGTTGWAAK